MQQSRYFHNQKKYFLTVAFMVVFSSVPAQAYNADEFCDAVYLTEGGAKTHHPYGVLSVSCNGEAECRQICLTSYRNNQKRFKAQDKYTDFVEFFASRWAPLNAENDPQGLNRNWIKNFRFFLGKGAK